MKFKYPFIPIPKAVIFDPRVDRGDLAVLMALYSFMDSESRTCYPKMSTLAERSRCSKRFARKHLKGLQEYGYVQIKRLGGGKYASTYYLIDKDPDDLSQLTSKVSDPLSSEVRAEREALTPVSSEDMPPLPYGDRHNKNHITKTNQQYSSEEEELFIFEIFLICNRLRKKRYDLPPLNPESESIKLIQKALRDHHKDDLILVAESYFSDAKGDYMKITNAFREDKIQLKLQIAKDRKHLKIDSDPLRSLADFLSTTPKEPKNV